jgi:uncharacterized protein (TIGR02996 family)
MDELLQAVLQNVDDDAPRWVHADWLEAHGAVERAELIRVQLGLRRTWLRRDLQKRERELLQLPTEKLAPELAGVASAVEYARGYAHAVTAPVAAFGAALLDSAPIAKVTFAEHLGRMANGWEWTGIDVERSGSLLRLRARLVPFTPGLAEDAEEPEDVFMRACAALGPRLEQLWLETPRDDNYGFNGTRPWTLDGLLDGAFDELRVLDIEGAGDNRPEELTVCELYSDEGGGIAAIASRAPKLERLAVPSAPTPDFFARRHENLRSLTVAAGWDHQSFIAQLAGATGLPALEELDFSDFYSEVLSEGEIAEGCTPRADFDALFATTRLRRLRRVTLRYCDVDEHALRKTPLGRQLDKLRVIGR